MTDHISVIIPTYRRPQDLMQALDSLQEQTLRAFEIIIVDNAADADLAATISAFNRSARVNVCYVSEPNLGLHNARHAGARCAGSELLVFTDDDATFDKGWLSAYAQSFSEHPEMVAAGGPVRPAWEVPPPLWLQQYMGGAEDFWAAQPYGAIR